jgi:hypothetical protein
MMAQIARAARFAVATVTTLSHEASATLG